MNRLVASCVILTAAWGGFSATTVQEPGRRATDVSVRVLQAAQGIPRVEVRREGGASAIVVLDNRTASVEDVRVVGPHAVVVHGKTSVQYPRTDTITVIDPATMRITDTIWALDASFSPDGRTVAYFFRVPETGCQGCAWGSVVAYDLLAPAAMSPLAASPGGDARDFHERGVVLYPDRHRREGSYWYLLDADAASQRDGLERHGFVPRIAWSPDSRRIGIVEYDGVETRLVVLDVSRGLQLVSVAKIPIPTGPFLAPGAATRAGTPGARDFRLFVKDLAFTEDGAGIVVTSYPTARFRADSLTLPVSAGVR